MRKYNTLILDVMNLAYRVFDHRHESPTRVAKKQVFQHAIVNFINTVARLKQEYLHADGLVYLLFDNPTSRVDLQTSFYFASRKQAYAKYKEKRNKEPKEFYNSIGLIKYYYMVQDPSFRTIQITNLEADDLVKPLLQSLPPEDMHLLVSNDLDWVRSVGENTHWLSGLSGEPDTINTLTQRLGFKVNEETLIAYKAIFGDEADNIPSIASKKLEPYFASLAEELTKADDIAFLSNSDKNIEKYPFLSSVRQDIRQFKINLQLIREIPVAARHLELTTTIGRNSQPMKNAIEKALGMREPAGFVFGDIKRPRVEK